MFVYLNRRQGIGSIERRASISLEKEDFPETNYNLGTSHDEIEVVERGTDRIRPIVIPIDGGFMALTGKKEDGTMVFFSDCLVLLPYELGRNYWIRTDRADVFPLTAMVFPTDDNTPVIQ